MTRRRPLKRRARLKPRRAKPRRSSRVRDREYLAWVRTQPCVCYIGMCRGRVHAHHAGPRGLGQKADDTTAVPLCARHHRWWHDSAGPFSVLDASRRARLAEQWIHDTQRDYAAMHGRAA